MSGENKIVGLDELRAAAQGKLEPIHKVNTVTGTNGSVTIQNMLEAPLLGFEVTGVAPSVVTLDGIGAAMGSQTWDNPMILDVPLGIFHHKNDFYSSLQSGVCAFYGGGVGATNTYNVVSGTNTGTTVYLNSRNLVDLFKDLDKEGTGTITSEGKVDGHYFYLFEIPLPFSVANNSTVWCSHLQNKNVSGEEGVWADGNTLYIRSYHLNNYFDKAANQLANFVKNTVYYRFFTGLGDFYDFFIMMTASTSFVKPEDPVVATTLNGAQSYDWLKISDYLSFFNAEKEEDLPTLTPLTNLSITYYTDITINRNLRETINGMIGERSRALAMGDGAFSSGGAAIGTGAFSSGGGAIGMGAVASGGAAVGDGAYAHLGAAIGLFAKTSNGVAIGDYAQCVDSNGVEIDAIQLGEGTNRDDRSLQVYGTKVLDWSNGHHSIAPALIGASKIEPKHETQTVTTSDGSFTITDALDAPVVKFSATGMGMPSVAAGSVEMGSQTWNNPMVLDVPIGVADSNSDALFLNYGGGIGSNTFIPTIGEETGNLIYYNSKQLADLFDYIDDQETGTVTDEANSYELFTCNLPFAVEGGSTIYCSHLKNQNVSGEEGIWADGSTLYIRAKKENSGRTFEGFADRLRAIAMTCNFYDPYNPVGVESYNFQDFFIMFAASANYTKETDRTSVLLGNGSKTLYYFKISDYLAAVQETTPNPTLMSNISVTYYLDTEVNQNHNNYTNLLIDKRFNGIASLGSGAVARFGGAVGEGALENYGGFAGGYHAKASTGGAIGAGASTIGGQGGAVGAETTTVDGGAVGYQAKTSDGFAGGRYAKCENSSGDPIDAIQLGEGTNQSPYTMKVYNTTLLRPRYEGSYSGGLVIPLSLITNSCNAGNGSEQNDFVRSLDILLGNIVRYSITNDLIGASIGTFVKITSDNTVSEAIDNGDVFIGQLVEVPTSGANTALVRIKGIMKTEASLGIGLHRVAFSDGALDESANGREIFVTSSINGQITFIV